jgi:hypothetical protein
MVHIEQWSFKGLIMGKKKRPKSTNLRGHHRYRFYSISVLERTVL